MLKQLCLKWIWCKGVGEGSRGYFSYFALLQGWKVLDISTWIDRRNYGTCPLPLCFSLRSAETEKTFGTYHKRHTFPGQNPSQETTFQGVCGGFSIIIMWPCNAGVFILLGDKYSVTFNVVTKMNCFRQGCEIKFSLNFWQLELIFLYSSSSTYSVSDFQHVS